MNRPIGPRDLFTVGFRLLGVWQILEAVSWFVACAEIQFGLSRQPKAVSMDYILHAAVDVAVGVALLRCKISLFWPEPDPDAPGFEVILPNDDPVASDREEKT